MTKDEFMVYAEKYDSSIAFIGIFDDGIELFNDLSEVFDTFKDNDYVIFKEYPGDILIFNEDSNVVFHAFKVHKALLLETAVSR